MLGNFLTGNFQCGGGDRQPSLIVLPLIAFSRGTAPIGSVSFSTNPDYNNYEKGFYFNQVISDTDGGVRFSYNKVASAKQTWQLGWRAMPKSDFDALSIFIETIAIGDSNTFTFRDIDTQAYTVQFEDAENIEGRIVSYFDDEDVYRVTLNLREV